MSTKLFFKTSQKIGGVLAVPFWLVHNKFFFFLFFNSNCDLLSKEPTPNKVEITYENLVVYCSE